MKKIQTSKFLLIFSISLLFFVSTGCDNNDVAEGCTDMLALNYSSEAETDDGSCVYPNLRVQFTHTLGTQEITLGNTYTINGTEVQINRINYYVSLINIMGPEADYPTNIQYLLVDGQQGQYDLGEGKMTHVHMLRFGLGVDSTVNNQTENDFTTYSSDNPLAAQSPNMHWNWNSGYKFFVIEGMVDTDRDGIVDTGMSFHTGTDALYRTITLEIVDDVMTEEHVFNVKLDLEVAFSEIDLATEFFTHTAGNLPLATKLADNLSAAFSEL